MQFPSPDQHILPDQIRCVQPPKDATNAHDTNRSIGSLVGLATGDALGASVEFRPRQYFLHNPARDLEGGGTWGLQAGQWTDDTSMALCLASSLISKKNFDPYDQMVRYKWWFKYGYLSSTGSCFDIGKGTSHALDTFVSRQKILGKEFNCVSEQAVDNLTWDQVRSVGKFDINCGGANESGNGALMRLAPIPMFFYNSPSVAVEYAGRSARLTHGDRKAIDACRYYAALIVAALHGEQKHKILDVKFYEDHLSWFGSKELHQDILRIAHGSYRKQNGYDDGIRGKSFCVNTLEAALWAFWSDKDSFENGALNAVNLGDDTDTTAAVYGQLAGAYYGYRGIPSKWLNKLYARDLLVCIGEWLHFEGSRYNTTKGTQKRSLYSEEPLTNAPDRHEEYKFYHSTGTPSYDNPPQAVLSRHHGSNSNQFNMNDSTKHERFITQPTIKQPNMMDISSQRFPVPHSLHHDSHDQHSLHHDSHAQHSHYSNEYKEPPTHHRLQIYRASGYNPRVESLGLYSTNYKDGVWSPWPFQQHYRETSLHDLDLYSLSSSNLNHDQSWSTFSNPFDGSTYHSHHTLPKTYIPTSRLNPLYTPHHYSDYEDRDSSRWPRRNYYDTVYGYPNYIYHPTATYRSNLYDNPNRSYSIDNRTLYSPLSSSYPYPINQFISLHPYSTGLSGFLNSRYY